MSDELVAGGMLHWRRDAHLHAELVGLMRLALADALDLRRMQRIDLASALMAILGQHAARQAQLESKNLFQSVVTRDPPPDIADHPTKVGLELAQAPVGALKLVRMGVALMLDQRQLANAPIGLTQLHAEFVGQSHQPLARPVEKLRVGREHYRLRLHRRVDHDASEVGRLHRRGSGRHRQALLQKRLQLLLSHPLAPARQRRAVTNQSVLETLLAAEAFEASDLYPPLPQHL